MEQLVVKGLAAGDPSLADCAIQWLCDEPRRFHLGDGHDELYWAPARDLINHFAPHCSEPVFAKLESAILAYHDDWERRSFSFQLEELKAGRLYRNDWGRAQNVLLSALPKGRMSAGAISIAAGWRLKFGDPAKEQPTNALVGGGMVTSPIPQNALLFVSDREWLRIIRTDWPQVHGGRWRQLGPNIVGEASVRHFADALGTAAARNPKRFALLALRIPRNANPTYFATLVRQLSTVNPPQETPGWEPVTIANLDAICDHVGECDDEDYVLALCHMVQTREDGQWSDRMTERIIRYAQHPHPNPDQYTCYRGSGDDSANVRDVALTGINCVRGAVAGAVTILLWRQPETLDRLLPAARRLLADPHPSVRYEALGVCLPIWIRDRNLAVGLAVAACEHEDDRVLGSRWLNRLIAHSRMTHLAQLLPIIERMARSAEDVVSEKGAAWATACWLDDGHFGELVESCRAGTKPQRLGVADATFQCFAHGDATEKCGPVLTALFRDPDSEVRSRAARLFGQDGVFDVSGSAELATDFVSSPAFLDDVDGLLYPLSEYTGDITRYTQTILAASDALSASLADDTRDLRHRNAFAGKEVSILLLRLYEYAYERRDQTLQNHCLDRWDKMLQNRVGGTDEHLKLLDR
ncbi:MAG: hypothetical protein GX616_11865 [Planctomycetes bacterium]|nr:hypothetical protein [Planctomycetota bacterium]